MESKTAFLIFFVGIQGGISRVIGTDSPPETAFLEADQFQTSYGYYPPSGLLPDQIRSPSFRKNSVTEGTKALKSLQKSYHIPQSILLNTETTQRSPQFDKPDINPNQSTMETQAVLEMGEREDTIVTRNRKQKQDREKSGIKVDRRRRSLNLSRKSRVKRNIYPTPDRTLHHWEFEKLRWRITNPSRHRPIRAQKKILKMAMALWENIVPVKFVEETQAPEADMHIVFHSFASTKSDGKMHRDSFWQRQQETVKDLPSSSGSSSENAKRKLKQRRRFYGIAHASYPKTSYRYSLRRDIHFDEDYKWSRKELFSVALHEIGHVLGLTDSSVDKKAVMFEVNFGNTAFTVDDIRAVMMRYGHRMKSSNPYICPRLVNAVDYIFKALIYPKAQIYYFILGGHVKLLSETHVLSSRSEGFLEVVFPYSPFEFDVIFSDQARKTVFIIKGNQLYQYRGPVVFGMERSYFVQMFIPETPKFAVTVDSPAGEDTILFGYEYWWVFEFDGKHVLKTQPNHRFTARISELLKSAKFAVRWTDGEVYVVMRNGSHFTLEFNITSNKTFVSPLERLTPVWMVHMLCRGDATTNRISGPSMMVLVVLCVVKLL